jgi:hypothetical protein
MTLRVKVKPLEYLIITNILTLRVIEIWTKLMTRSVKMFIIRDAKRILIDT